MSVDKQGLWSSDAYKLNKTHLEIHIHSSIHFQSK